MEVISTMEVEDSTMEESALAPSVQAKKEWLRNAFNKKEKTVTQPRPGKDLVQERHRWIQEEVQLRTTMKRQGKSDKAISHELVAARKRWMDNERKKCEKYQETILVRSPASERSLLEEKKECDKDARTKPADAGGEKMLKKKTETLPRPGKDLVQERHRWIQEEVQLRTTLKSQGKSDIAISHELVAARTQWMGKERKKYEETIAMRTPVGKRFLKEEKKESDEHARNKPDAVGENRISPDTEIKMVVSQDVVEVRKKWLEEEAVGSNNWLRPFQGVLASLSSGLSSALSMQTKVGLTNESEDHVNAPGAISPRDALRLTFEATNTLKSAATSEFEEDRDDDWEDIVKSNIPISNEKTNSTVTSREGYDTDISERQYSDEREISDEIASRRLMFAIPVNNKKTNERVLDADGFIGEASKLEQVGNPVDAHCEERKLDCHGDTSPHNGVSNEDILSQAQIDISAANPGQEAAGDRDVWKVVSADSDPVETTLCLEVCSILNPVDDHCGESTPTAENERVLDADESTGEASKPEQVGNPVDAHYAERKLDYHNDTYPHNGVSNENSLPQARTSSSAPPMDEHLGLSANPGQEAADDHDNWKVVSADSDLVETTPCLDVWKIVPADSDLVETTPCQEVCSAKPGEEAADDRDVWKVASADSDIVETTPCLDIWKIVPADSDPAEPPCLEVCSIL
jgi:hypothetical protein